jgi:2,5-diketo-D-gluconate reductase B
MPKDIPQINGMPVLGLGTWDLLGDTCTNSVKMALDLGYRHIDTADVYHNHQAIANAIQDFPREQLYIVTKIAEDNLRPSRILQTCERFLRELKTPYIDQLLIHWPILRLPPAHSLEEMFKLQQRGLVRHIGVSNFGVELLQGLEHFPLFANQIELSPYLPQQALANYCQSHGIAVVAYSPIKEVRKAPDPLLTSIAKNYGKTPIQVSLRWIIQLQMAVIPKATSFEHLQENMNIFDFSLSDEEMQKISNL